MRYRSYRVPYGDDSVIPVVGDIMQNASPTAAVHPDDPSASEAQSVAAQLDQVAATAGGQVRQVVAGSSNRTVGWVALALAAWAIFG